MNAMTPDEAFQLLGISSNADETELTKAFHERSRQHHPDAGAGSSEMQVRLNAAREVASAFIADRKALIPLRLQQSVQEFEKQIGAERAARQAQEVTNLAIRRRIRPLQQIKYGALIIAGIAGAVGWFGENLLPRIFVNPSTDVVPFRDEFKMAAIWLAAISGILHFIAQRHAFLVEATKERLDDAESCAAELADALSFENRNQVRQGDISFERKQRIPFLPFDVVLGLERSERQRLLILKSIEHGLLESIGPKNTLPASNRMYKVTFQPSQFAPRPREPRPPPPPMQLAEAVGVFSGMLIAASFLNALTLYLYPSAWAWLSGVFGVMFSFACVMVGSIELVPAIRRRIAERRRKRTTS